MDVIPIQASSVPCERDYGTLEKIYLCQVNGVFADDEVLNSERKALEFYTGYAME